PSLGKSRPTHGSGRCCFGRPTCTSGVCARPRRSRRAACGRDASAATSDTRRPLPTTPSMSRRPPGRAWLWPPRAGGERWRVDLRTVITAAPTVAGNIVLIGTQDGLVVGLQAQTGAVLWDFKTAGQLTASPIVAGDTMYVASHDGTLYAVSRSPG